MKNYTLLIIFIFTSTISIGQTKKELSENIISYQRALSEDWIETSIEDCILKIVKKDIILITGKEIDVFTINLSELESIKIKENLNLRNNKIYYDVTAYLSGETCKNQKFQTYQDYLNGKPTETYYLDGRNIISIQGNKKSAQKFVNILSQLAEKCGSKKIIKFD